MGTLQNAKSCQTLVQAYFCQIKTKSKGEEQTGWASVERPRLQSQIINGTQMIRDCAHLQHEFPDISLPQHGWVGECS
jgi:hypothetical protein